MRFHSFYTSNLPKQIVDDHKRCSERIGLEVCYHEYPSFNTFDEAFFAHGEFETRMMEDETDDVVCFIDVDCLPTSEEVLYSAYSWAKANDSFVGNAQNIGHMQHRNYLYAAPGLIIISKKAWEKLGKPSFKAYHIPLDNGGELLIDTAQEITNRANQIGMDYQLIYPIGFDSHRCRLAHYGYIGKGTLYPGSWHYFRISDFIGKEKLPELWNRRVNDIMSGNQIIPNYSSRYY